MAEILLAEEWAQPTAVASQLQYDLPEEYLVVSDPTVQGRELDAVVVAPQGLFVLHAAAELGEAAAPGDDEGEPGPDQAAFKLVEERVGGATKALRAFLRDEFPALTPSIYHLLVFDGVPEGTGPEVPAGVTVTTVAAAAAEIEGVQLPAPGALKDARQREELAVALQERKLSLSQRASEPFVFRAGDMLGSGTEVWTIREAVRHMASDPESGVFHLRNGTLAAWLESEGAEHLARLAREVVRTETDRRAALETFLIATGLVERPRINLRPEEIDLGYLTAGDSVARRIHIGKGRGRGYLFGRLEPSVPWLSVYPRSFSGESADTDISVSADTESLPIGQRPREASIFVDSNASEEPLEIPVRLRVMGMPSELNRRFFRPVAGFMAAAFVGGWLGAMLTLGGAPAADFLSRLPVSSAAIWTLSIALVWGAFGALRGARQPVAWPTAYAMGRWLFRTLVWAVALSLVGAAAIWAWAYLRPAGAGLPGEVLRVLLVVPMTVAIAPGTIGEILATTRMHDTSAADIRWSYLRPFFVPLAAVALALAGVLGAPQIRPALERLDMPAVAGEAREWTEDRLSQAGERLDDAIDRLYLRYYDRRAPGGDGE